MLESKDGKEVCNNILDNIGKKNTEECFYCCSRIQDHGATMEIYKKYLIGRTLCGGFYENFMQHQGFAWLHKYTSNSDSVFLLFY